MQYKYKNEVVNDPLGHPTMTAKICMRFSLVGKGGQMDKMSEYNDHFWT